MASVPVAIWALATGRIDRVDLALLIGFYVFTFLGVTVGFHRYVVHRSFKTNRLVGSLLIIAGSMAVSGTPLFWAAGHVCHHAKSDGPGDPHSPRRGFWHAQFLWLIKPDSHPDYDKYARSFRSDPWFMRLNASYPIWVVVSLAIPAAIGGWSGLLWGGLVRILLMHHVGWLVNSLCHLVGSRPFETRDDSRNLGVLSPFTMGDSWHNNHHAFPRAAFHGFRWWQFDPSGIVIRAMELTRLATDVVRPSPTDLARRSAR